MLSRLFAKNLLRRPMYFQMRAFSTEVLSTPSAIDHALQEPTNVNWGQFMTTIKPEDVLSANLRTMKQLLKLLSYQKPEVPVTEESKKVYEAIDRYFKVNFRKMTSEEALDVLLPLGDDNDRKLHMLDDKFWVWETLEEAVRPAVKTLPEEDTIRLIQAFGANFKGSEDLWDFMFQRVYKLGATLIGQPATITHCEHEAKPHGGHH